jgi:UDPglucose 6-dehydrogenase
VAAYEGVTLTTDLEEAVKDRDCVAIVTRHREYLDIKLDWLKKLLATPVIVDGRNVFNPKEVLSSGFTFRGVGIGTDTKQSKKE